MDSERSHVADPFARLREIVIGVTMGNVSHTRLRF